MQFLNYLAGPIEFDLGPGVDILILVFYAVLVFWIIYQVINHSVIEKASVSVQKYRILLQNRHTRKKFVIWFLVITFSLIALTILSAVENERQNREAAAKNSKRNIEWDQCLQANTPYDIKGTMYPYQPAVDYCSKALSR